jgi:hypothetical protein
MPWVPELFTAPALEQLQERRQRDAVLAVPFFAGLLAGEPDALLGSFAGEPELHHPVRGRIKGARAFTAFVAWTSAWWQERNVEVEDVQRVILDTRGFEEVVLHFDGDDGRVQLPFALVADHPVDNLLSELRIYFPTRLLTGRPAMRPPLLQPDPDLHVPAFVAGHSRDPAADVALEACALVDDGHSCALEYNVVGWGATAVPPQAGVAVHVRGADGALAATRVYDDAEPPPVPDPQAV